ncbi:cobalt-precorrin-6A reductase [Nioella nitratireducens]|uniref:cobalt-precorrin-6A reductase n=1 Tax=Nioella nitratireducens TaxID=1287720 RepID=UPI0008FD5160|nr:cobalt-precorrin-6A reductase [Nioella nitratireducens]
MTRVLLLGGTTEATALARLLAEARVDAIFSYAGRTDKPMAQPLPMRVGGFGGVAGLVAYLRAEKISHVVDATHPFAAQMSTNAVAACAEAGVPLVGLERPGWHAEEGDAWTHVADMGGAVAALPSEGARVFLAIGKQHVSDFAVKPGNFYLLRLVDPPKAALPLPNAEAVIARGPFDLASDRQLLERHAITHIVAKNGGGAGARAKLDAARALGLPVVLVDRPHVPPRRVLTSADAVMAWLDHSADLGV